MNKPTWSLDFNDAVDPFVIPKGTVVHVRLEIKPGGYNDPAQGWTDGIATKGDTGSVFLKCEFTVLDGPYAKRKLYSNIGLYSPKEGSTWANQGRAFIRGIINSRYGLSENDQSLQAQTRRKLKSLADLNGAEFWGRTSIGKDQNDDPKVEIQRAVTPDHKDYPPRANAASPVKAPWAEGVQLEPTIEDEPNNVIKAGVRPTWAQ